MVRPNLSSASSPRCANYHPNVSHFVLIDISHPVFTGVAASDWTRFPYGADLERSVSVQTEVLQTAQMLRREWRLQIESPAFVPCLRRFLTSWYVAIGGELLSFRRVAFPRLAPHSAAFRIVGRVSGLEPHLTEFALIGKSRTELNLSVFGLRNARTWVAAQTVRLARILVGRLRA